MQKANAAEGGGAFAYDGAIGPQAWPGEVCMTTSLPSSAVMLSSSAAANMPQHSHIAILPLRDIEP